MGIYDRDYYQDRQSSFLGSLATSGQVCKYLIAINVVVFLLQIMSLPRHDRLMDATAPPTQGPVTDALILDTQEVAHGQVWRLLTYAFLHDPNSLFHIVFNMLFLWWFGKDVEDLYGPREFLCFYLVSALLGGLAFQLWGLDGPHRCLGASGAVTAVLVVCAAHYPTRVILLMFIIPVPIWAFVVFSVAQDTLRLVNNTHSGIAVVVHLAGAAFGFFYYKRQWRLMNLWPDIAAWRRQLRRPKLRVYREEDPRAPVAVAAPPRGDVDEQLEAKVDAVLEKVARSGQASLSESERQLLLRASEIYRKKRT